MQTTRPDFSDYLAHFAKDGAPCGIGDVNNAGNKYSGMSAGERLISILTSEFITASNLPWTGRQAVCFTECPWASLLDHAKRYSSFAVGFTKPHIFAAGGGPAYYVRADHYQKQTWDSDLHTFVTPFWPSYRPANLQDKKYLSGHTIDYTHEREWRVPHDFKFKLSQIKFVILPTYEDMAKFPQNLKDQIGREKFLLMDIYRTIEDLWPVHNIA
jgi:hypothetical protein